MKARVIAIILLERKSSVQNKWENKSKYHVIGSQ
jgi:hypothetical protein